LFPGSSLSIPFPSPDNATLVKRVVEVDKPLKPSELERHLEVQGNLLVAFVFPRLPSHLI
jgi:hypothetical protein